MSTVGGAATARAPKSPETREQKSWYWYDWANSAYVTTTATVLFAPYLTSVATRPPAPTSSTVSGVRRRCRSWHPGVTGVARGLHGTFSTIISAIFLIFVGAIADRSPHPTKLFATFAWTGALAATLMCLVTGTNWQLGVLLFVIANICLGSSLVIYDSLLVRIAGPNDRDRVSSKGWAFGYLGGGLLLLVNFVLVAKPSLLGLDRGGAVR
jgi:UMF1 family MFS transporter